VSGERTNFWDKIAVLLTPIGGLLTALSVAVVGVKGSQVLERRQAADTNARLYSELMSRREEAESNLRKDMLLSIIRPFLGPRDGEIDALVLNLELLAYNFHDSINLKPLFMDLQRRIVSTSDPRRDEYLKRLNRVARDITAKQLFSLEGHGDSFRRTIDLEELTSTGRFGIALEGESIRVGDKGCHVSLRVLEVDPRQQQVRLRLEVSAPEGASEGSDTRATFDVGFFDFPMIDNTRLANGLKCAVTLSAFTPASADLTTTCFPAEFASLKDRPYYDEVIHKLQSATQATAGE
jgi:hypothetical protein